MLDTNIFDKLLVDSLTVERLKRLVMCGKIQLLITSVQVNQIEKIADEAKRSALLTLLSELSLNKLFVEYAPYSYAYGECYGGLSPYAILDHERFVTSQGHIEDAMIAATASSTKYELDYVVTDDDRFRRKLNAQGLSTKAIRYGDFCQKISSMAT